MYVLNRHYKKESLDGAFWREIGVRYDAIMEQESLLVHKKLSGILVSLRISALKELCQMYGLDCSNSNEEGIKESLLKLGLEERRLLLLLHDLSNRKKKTIERYYNGLTFEETRFECSTLAKLLHLYRLSPIHLVEIFTCFVWDSKSSGKKYIFSNKISVTETRKIANEESYNKELKETLFKGTGSKNYYRVFSFSMHSKKVLILLYRQISDAPKPDFVSAPRNREVSQALFLIDAETNTVEIKSLVMEENSIKAYLDKTLGALSPIESEVFSAYEKDTFINSIVNGSTITASGKPVTDFMVYKIKFRGSPLRNSPQITLELDCLDIWPSVEEAYSNGTINLASVKDLESLYFKSSLGNRSIRSTILGNGNIIFTMDDSNLSVDNKKILTSKFFEKFGIPLFAEISNEHFEEGKADKIDYLLSISKIESPSSFVRSMLGELRDHNIIQDKTTRFYYCDNCKIEYTYEKDEEVPILCMDCEGDRIRRRSNDVLTVNIEAIYLFVKNKCKTGDAPWKIVRENHVKVGSSEFKCLHLWDEENEKGIQVLVTEKALHKAVLKNLNRLLKPTLLILVGQIEKLIDYSSYSCVEPINFGKIYMGGEREFPSILKDFSDKIYSRSKTYLSAAANDAHTELTAITTEKINDKKYSDKNFEDDVFVILKDIFPNAEKWGKELSGKAVPEGIFTLSYKDRGDSRPKQYVFSYDCKLNTNGQGYNLNKGEQRKALEYVNTLNANDYIKYFSDRQQLSGHIFISNKFNENNFKTMTEHFYKHLDDQYDTKAIFLDVDVLVYLHSIYLEYYELLRNSRNLFYKGLFELFSYEHITRESVDKALKKALDEKIAEYQHLEMHKITEELKTI
ncbi:hypothetical protein LK13_15035 [Paenibacillus polymyxa]|nr:hypothetical protein PPSQR21_004150 [Paenibacillus polymyxa SQR-21]AIY09792.1 hypothetical protein LK13_15035 [Paenibacillus polymyxa]